MIAARDHGAASMGTVSMFQALLVDPDRILFRLIVAITLHLHVRFNFLSGPDLRLALYVRR